MGIDSNLLTQIKHQLRKQAFIPASDLGQQDPAMNAPPMMAQGPAPVPGQPPGPPGGGDAAGGPPPGGAGPGGLPPGIDPNMIPGSDPTQDPASTVGQDPNALTAGLQSAAGKGKNSGKINDMTFIATEVGELKGRVNLLLEMMQGQLAPTKSASKKVAVDEQTLWTLLEMLKAD